MSKAISSKSTLSSNCLFLKCIFKIDFRPSLSGNPTKTFLSKRPGLTNAESKISALFVAPNTIIPYDLSKPSIFVKIWFNVCSLSSFPELKPVPRCLPIASIS